VLRKLAKAHESSVIISQNN